MTVQLGPVYGPMVIFAAATGLRPSELFGLEQRDVDRQLGVVYVRRAYANGRLKYTKTRLSTRGAAASQGARSARPATRIGQSDPVSEHARRQDRLPDLRPQALAAGTDKGRNRVRPWPLRPASHLRDLRATGRRAGVHCLPLHGHEHRDDRPSLRPSRQRQPRPCRRAPRRARVRAGGRRCVDVAAPASKAAHQRTSRPRRMRTRQVVDARWTPRLVSVASTDD